MVPDFGDFLRVISVYLIQLIVVINIKDNTEIMLSL
jgi:hypothetical protein